MIPDRGIGYFTFFVLFFSLNVYGRHTDTNRDISSCPDGFWPLSIKNEDGFLKLTCFKPRCDEINKYKPVCAAGYTDGCAKGFFVGSIHREFHGTNEKAEYKCKCCSHPKLQNPVSIRPIPDFKPDAEQRDAAAGQSDYIDVLTNVVPSSKFDHHGIEITSIMCRGSSTTRRSTVRPSTQKPDNRDHPNNPNPNNPNGGGGGGGGPPGSNSGNNGGQGGDGHGGDHGGQTGDGHGGQGGDHGGQGGDHGGHGGQGGDGHGGQGGQGGDSHGHGGQGGDSHGHGGQGGDSHGHGGQGGDSHGHGGSHECGGPTGGCNQNPPLEGGSENHYPKIHVPKPDKPPHGAEDPKAWGLSPRGGGSGCFSADTLVRTRKGEKRMDEVEIGDEILSSASWDGNGAISYQRITQFIHKDPSVTTRYTVIHTNSGRSLSLTPYHLLPHFDCHILERPSVSVREYELLFTQSAKFAYKARAGQCVLVVDTSGKFVAERISNVTSAVRQGVFSPITASGIIVVNGVQASCYSSVENHAIQHAFFMFVHKVTQAWKPYVDQARRLFSSMPLADDGQIPLLLRVMLVLSNLVMGSF